MNLPKAIELNKEAEKSLRDHKFIDYADAVKLGGVAIAEVIEARLMNNILPHSRLPGETKD
ncbi:hypothetical protein ES708_10289 [subsurface metagenome]